MERPDLASHDERIACARILLEFEHGRHKIRAKVLPPPLGLGLAPRWLVTVDGDERERLGPVFHEGEGEDLARARIQWWMRRGYRGDF